MRTITVDDVVTVGSPGVADADGRRWVFDRFDGWDSPEAATRGDEVPRPRAHGAFSRRRWRGVRAIAVRGAVLCPSRASAAEAVMLLDALLADGQDGTLRVADDDLPSLSATVHLGSMSVDWVAGATTVRFNLELVGDDPLRYADVVSAATGFPERTGGLRWPMFSDGAGNNVGATDWGPIGTTGRAVVTNTGTADSWPQFQIEGPTPVQGFEIIRVGSGTRTVFTGPVSATSQLVIDQATGLALMGGKADRTLAIFEPEPVRPGETAEYAFVNRGVRTDAQLTVSIRPAHW